MKKRALTLLLAVCLVCSLCVPARAASASALDTAVAETGAYLQSAVTAPEIGSVGGDWAVIGLARSGVSVPESWFQGYLSAAAATLKADAGVLSEKKYTEFSRVALALTAVGADPRSFAGYDLLLPLGDYDKTVYQGVNGAAWALLALDAKNYDVPRNTGAKTQATRQLYVDALLSAENADGGWALSGTVSDPDMTGMVLLALSNYRAQSAVETAVQKALAFLSAAQNASGGFATGGTATAESDAQVVTALSALGVSQDDARFVKNGKSALDSLLSWRLTGGGFRHLADGGVNEMATEQGFYALVAAQRAQNGQNALFRMSDAVTRGTVQSGAGLPGKNADVKVVPVTKPGTTFADISGHENQTAVETLAARGILNGKSENRFDPNATMTRAEFAATVVRALGLTPKAGGKFADVPAGSWFAAYVGTACSYGIVNGVSETSFAPAGTITRQEAALMVSRAAALCGLDTALTADETRDALAPFSDYTQTDTWARAGLAFCCRSGILDSSALTIRPKDAVLRCEVAQMVCNLLQKAALL